jgi:hypothetical protein
MELRTGAWCRYIVSCHLDTHAHITDLLLAFINYQDLNHIFMQFSHPYHTLSMATSHALNVPPKIWLNIVNHLHQDFIYYAGSSCLFIPTPGVGGAVPESAKDSQSLHKASNNVVWNEESTGN